MCVCVCVCVCVRAHLKSKVTSSVYRKFLFQIPMFHDIIMDANLFIR